MRTHLLLQEVPLAVADQSVAGRRQVGGVGGVGDAGQQRRRLLLLRRHGFDGLLLVFRQQEVARRQLDRADGRGLPETTVRPRAVGPHQGPKVRLVQVAGRLGLVVLTAEALLGGQRGSQAVCGLHSPQVVSVRVPGAPSHHVCV